MSNESLQSMTTARCWDVHSLIHAATLFAFKIDDGEHVPELKCILEMADKKLKDILAAFDDCVPDEQCDDYYGLCPECHSAPVILNVKRVHFGVCHTHKLCWEIGANLFDGWRAEPPEVWKFNEDLLRGYKLVEVYHYPNPPIKYSDIDDIQF